MAILPGSTKSWIQTEKIKMGEKSSRLKLFQEHEPEGYTYTQLFNPNPHCCIAITKATACG
jgi:hypothetical protein